MIPSSCFTRPGPPNRLLFLTPFSALDLVLDRRMTAHALLLPSPLSVSPSSPTSCFTASSCPSPFQSLGPGWRARGPGAALDCHLARMLQSSAATTGSSQHLATTCKVIGVGPRAALIPKLVTPAPSQTPCIVSFPLSFTFSFLFLSLFLSSSLFALVFSRLSTCNIPYLNYER